MIAWRAFRRRLPSPAITFAGLTGLACPVWPTKAIMHRDRDLRL